MRNRQTRGRLGTTSDPTAPANRPSSLGFWMLSASRMSATLAAVIAVAVGCRIAVLVYAATSPIRNEAGRLVSPFHAEGTDLGYYRMAAAVQKEMSLASMAQRFVDFYAKWDYKLVEFVDVGPLVPALINAFDHGPSNALPMSLAWMSVSGLFCVVWLVWLAKHQVHPVWLFAAALLPNPIWYGLGVGTDMPFALFFALFFVSYFRRVWEPRHVVIWMACCVLMASVRPNVLSVLIFVCLDLTRRLVAAPARRELVLLGLSTALLTVAALFYLPYFYGIFLREGPPLDYFGVPPSSYANGLFADLPHALDQVLSWLIYLGAKTLYFVGLRPSYGDVPLPLVLVRAAPGLILLPGLVWIFVKGSGAMRLLVLLFVVPVLLGPAQERYNLAIQPLLLFYGALAYERILRRRSREGVGSLIEGVSSRDGRAPVRPVRSPPGGGQDRSGDAGARSG